MTPMTVANPGIQADRAEVLDQVADIPSRQGQDGSIRRCITNPDDLPDIICVDLDGTLLRTDTLYEALFAVARDWRVLARVPLWLMGGKANLKRHLTARASLEPALLPFNRTLLEYLREQKALGRTLVLTTAADRHIAEQISAHFGIFDEVIASDGQRNLRGAEKALAIRRRFGERPVTYIGNDASDLAVWSKAAAAVPVNAPAAVVRRLQALGRVEAVIEERGRTIEASFRALRPHQWVKNLLIFVPIITANAWMDGAGWWSALLMFAAFSLTASAIYVVNDLIDLAADRRHPNKRHRPFASAAVPIQLGMGLAPLLLLAGLGVGAAVDGVSLLITYAILSNLYSFWFKSLPIVDVFVLAALYMIRLYSGGAITGHELSPWLIAFSGFLFLSLALIKRVAELGRLSPRTGAKAAGRGYLHQDLSVLQLMGVSASFIASLVLALYVQSETVALRYISPDAVWALVPLILFWLCRLWFATGRGQMHDDPIVFTARDPVSWGVGTAVLATMILANLRPL